MSKVNSFVFYRSYLKAIETLEEKDQLKLFKAIACQGLGENVPELSEIPKAMLALIAFQMEEFPDGL